MESPCFLLLSPSLSLPSPPFPFRCCCSHCLCFFLFIHFSYASSSALKKVVSSSRSSPCGHSPTTEEKESTEEGIFPDVSTTTSPVVGSVSVAESAVTDAGKAHKSVRMSKQTCRRPCRLPPQGMSPPPQILKK
ncbi:hypothetical protein TRSC58_07330 [Trypanosoma rangeli SC58]|uniref:Uncharacterized protein n=1 Tax=Trypanosoma rangeli SC58 TaxID=429131 RepID=A0A061IRP4_TRYRA|nr:hypothetical protein TRSC58_07330 [Trypanosoma rangeli SC58]